VTRKPLEELDLVHEDEPKIAPKNPNEPRNEPRNEPESQILEIIGSNPSTSYEELVQLTQKSRSSIMRQIARLKASGRLKRIGPKKGGHWDIVE